MGGKLIVFEGVEGCGKTPVAANVEWLQEERGMLLSLVNRAEQRLVLTEVVASFSWKTDSIRLLYAADRAQHVEEVLNPRLAQGQLFCAIATLIPPLPTRVMVGVLASVLSQLNPLPPEDWKAT